MSLCSWSLNMNLDDGDLAPCSLFAQRARQLFKLQMMYLCEPVNTVGVEHMPTGQGLNFTPITTNRITADRAQKAIRSHSRHGALMLIL